MYLFLKLKFEHAYRFQFNLYAVCNIETKHLIKL